MDGCGAVAISCPLQINSHAAVAIYPIMIVIDVADLLLNLCCFGIIICLPVLAVVVVGIRADPQPPQEPTNAEFFLMTVNKSISL